LALGVVSVPIYGLTHGVKVGVVARTRRIPAKIVALLAWITNLILLFLVAPKGCVAYPFKLADSPRARCILECVVNGPWSLFVLLVCFISPSASIAKRYFLLSFSHLDNEGTE